MSLNKTPKPRVSIVMAVYNAARFLEAAVSSILVQTYGDFELIVVDDSSSDNSLSILESFTDSRMRIIKHGTNLGASLSRNHALALAHGGLVAIMDADDLCVPTRLERQVDFLDNNPLVGVVGCGIYDNIDATGTVLHTSFLPEDNATIQRVLMERWCFLHSSLMFRKALYQAIGGYRKAFEPAEDHDFLLRILERCQAQNLDERLVSYRLNPKGLSVFGHQHVKQSRDAAVRLAHRRRRNEHEDLDSEVARLFEFKRRRKNTGGFGGAREMWRDSLYVANRYYGFGWSELCAGHLQTARRCFVRSLRTNGLYVKSWIGIVLSLIPFAASRLNFASEGSSSIRGGRRHDSDLARPSHPQPKRIYSRP